jgi:acyl carrier protein
VKGDAVSEADLRAALTGFIRDNLMRDIPYEIDEDTPLLEAGILDSLKTAMLLNFLRDGLGTPVPPHRIDARNFHSVRTIAAMAAELSAIPAS